MKNLTRQEVKTKLINKKIDILKYHMRYDDTYIWELLQTGFKGYTKYSNEELILEYERDFQESINII